MTRIDAAQKVIGQRQCNNGAPSLGTDCLAQCVSTRRHQSKMDHDTPMKQASAGDRYRAQFWAATETVIDNRFGRRPRVSTYNHGCKTGSQSDRTLAGQDNRPNKIRERERARMKTCSCNHFIRKQRQTIPLWQQVPS